MLRISRKVGLDQEGQDQKIEGIPKVGNHDQGQGLIERIRAKGTVEEAPIAGEVDQGITIIARAANRESIEGLKEMIVQKD